VRPTRPAHLILIPLIRNTLCSLAFTMSDDGQRPKTW
jgi:hypothetical protein